MNIEILLPSLFEFYAETGIFEADECNKYKWERHSLDENSHFTGLSLKTIKKHMYSFTEGLDDLKKIEADVNLGGSTCKFIWDDFDGDDMSYDRYVEGMPCMKKRIRTHGIGSGRMINVHVNISEFGCTDYKSMLNKAYTAIQIIDMLEDLGYRVGVTVYDATSELGYMSEKNGGHKIDFVQVEVPLKKHEEPLNKALILNCISPWFERYWMFRYHMAKFNCSFGMGKAADKKLPDTTTDIYIKQGECLSKSSADRKIKEIKELFKIQQFWRSDMLNGRALVQKTRGSSSILLLITNNISYDIRHK